MQGLPDGAYRQVSCVSPDLELNLYLSLQGLPDGAASRGLLAAARRLEGYDAPFAPAAMHVTAADCHARLRDIRELVRSSTQEERD